MYPGRWNRKGQPALYASLEVGTAALEVFSHLPKNVLPKGHALMKIKLDLTSGSPLLRLSFFRVFNDFDTAERTVPTLTSPDLLAKLGPAAVFVPSALAPVHNAVLFPGALGFRERVTLESVEAFEFHPALFPANVALDDPQSTTRS